MYDIRGEGLCERLMDLHQLTSEQRRARCKLSAVITHMMREPMSQVAKVEVNAFGVPFN